MIDETRLLQMYDRDIRIIVNRYLYLTQFSTNCSYYEDLISEARLAFLVMCRGFELQDYQLTDLQRAMIKNKIESVLRVYIWKVFNMGGYNNRKIDLSRSVTISDILRDGDLTIDDVVPNTYQEDFSKIESEDFLKSLSKKSSSLLILMMQGKNLREIGTRWKENHSSLSRRIQRIQQKYLAYAKAASIA